jgi:hypothetical protein
MLPSDKSNHLKLQKANVPVLDRRTLTPLQPLLTMMDEDEAVTRASILRRAKITFK